MHTTNHYAIDYDMNFTEQAVYEVCQYQMGNLCVCPLPATCPQVEPGSLHCLHEEPCFCCEHPLYNSQGHRSVKIIHKLMQVLQWTVKTELPDHQQMLLRNSSG